MQFFASKNYKLSALATFALTTLSWTAFPGPLANKFDPQCNPSGSGLDRYPALYDEDERGRWNFAIDVSPYYQDADKGRNWSGESQYRIDPLGSGTDTANLKDVGIFEERGAWNMLGVAYGVAEEIFRAGAVPAVATPGDKFPANSTTEGASVDFLPSGFEFINLADGTSAKTVGVPTIGGKKLRVLVGEESWTYANYRNLVDALWSVAFSGQSSTLSGTASDTTSIGSHVLNPADNLAYRIVDGTDIISPQTNDRFSQVFDPNSQSFDDENYEKQTYGFHRPQPQFRRYGLRWKGSLTFIPGFKVWAKGGICEYKMRPIPLTTIGAEVRSSGETSRSSKKSSAKTRSMDFVISRSSLDQQSKDFLESLDSSVEQDLSAGNDKEKIISYLDQQASTKNQKPHIKRALQQKSTELRSNFDPKNASEEPTRSSSLSGEHSRAIDSADQDVITKSFFNPTSMRQILSELGYDMDPYNEWTVEDTYVAADFAYPLMFRSNEGHDVVKVWPTLSVGAWLPTSKTKKPAEAEHLFRVPIGNDGHTGVSVDGSMNFDFKGSITMNVGVGATFFDKKTFDKFAIKTHPKQRGIKPWLVKMDRRLGETYCAHGAIVSSDFIDGMTAYAEYSYISHKNDDLIVATPELKALMAEEKDMQDALNDQIRETAWSTQELHCGLSYQVTQNLDLGVSFKAHVAGEAVPRVKTVMGTMRIAF